MLKDLNNKNKAILLEDIKTINDFTIPKGTKIKMVNKLEVTAILDLLPYTKSQHTTFPLYFRVVVKSENMFAKVKRVK